MKLRPRGRHPSPLFEAEPDPFAAEQSFLRIPREEYYDLELDLLVGGLETQPIPFVRAGDTRLLNHALRTDDDASEAEIDVRECPQQSLVELGRTLMPLKSAVELRQLVAAVGRQCRQQPLDITVVLRQRVRFPELADSIVLSGVERSLEQFARCGMPVRKGVVSAWPTIP